jgi:NDP-sugar pyrophosphorylase family protein
MITLKIIFKLKKMIQGFEKIQKEFANYDENIKISEKELVDFRKNTIVALTAGGLGQRASEIKGMSGINKNAYKLPNGKSIVEMAIELFKKSGYTNFVAMVFHKAESIVEQLGDGSKFGVEIKYSYDPEHPVGRGGAILNALINNSVPREKNLIVYNPTDVILNYEGDFANDLAKAHISNTKKGLIATVVTTPGFQAPCTCMRLEKSIITDIEFHPIIPLPSHMGITILSPKMYPYLDKYIDLSKKCDFEQVLFPILAQERKIGATEIPQESWYPVKDLKTLERLEEALKEF